MASKMLSMIIKSDDVVISNLKLYKCLVACTGPQRIDFGSRCRQGEGARKPARQTCVFDGEVVVELSGHIVWTNSCRMRSDWPRRDREPLPVGVRPMKPFDVRLIVATVNC